MRLALLFLAFCAPSRGTITTERHVYPCRGRAVRTCDADDASIAAAAGRARRERRQLAICLPMEGARLQRRACVAEHPEGVDLFEEDGRE